MIEAITHLHPAQFPRRVLLSLAGHSPAIITETVYALSQQDPPYVPTEIHIITTASGKQRVQQTLLGENGALAKLCADYNLPMPALPVEHIHVIQHAGAELADIQSEADNRATADFISAVVRELTADADASLHVSIAGGRKTMTYYLGYSLSLFGRMQDRLSHVLVDDHYAQPQFYYPTPYSHAITNPRTGETFDAQTVSIKLGELPFIRLREGLGFAKALTQGALGFYETVERVQRQFDGVQVKLHQGDLYANGLVVKHPKFKATGLAIYVWLLLRQRDGLGGITYPSKADRGNRDYSRELLAVYRALHGDKGINKMEEAIEASGLTLEYLRPHFKHCNTALEVTLHKAAAFYCIETAEQSGKVHYHLPTQLSVDNIHLPFAPDYLASL